MSTNDVKTPAEVFAQLHDYVLKFDADGQAELFNENGTWEFPLAKDPMPKKITGREGIRKFGKMGMQISKEKGRKLTAYANLRIHQTTEADTIIVEFDLEGEIITSGTTYSIPFIQLLKIQNNKILLLRDYFDASMMMNPQ